MECVGASPFALHAVLAFGKQGALLLDCSSAVCVEHGVSLRVQVYALRDKLRIKITKKAETQLATSSLGERAAGELLTQHAS